MEKSPFQTEELLPQSRSTFLTVLCVLTFLGSVFGIFRGITAYSSAAKVAAETQKSVNQQQQQRQKKSTERNHPESKFELKIMDSVGHMTEKNIKLGGIISLAANLITLLAAILMWRLNRTGFYLYVAGVLTEVFAPLVIYGTGSFIAVMASALTGFIGLVFIVLYAFNVKDMKRFVRATA